MITKKGVNKSDREPFSSYDMGCCAALSALGFKLLQIDKEAGLKCLFIFQWDAEVEMYAQKYWRGELRLNALTYFNALKNLKNRIHSS